MPDISALRRLSGGCQCGDVRYEIAGALGDIYVCHCVECRRQSSSAFGISVSVKSVDLRLVKGALSRFTRPTASGRTLDCFFCPRCGSRVWHGDIDVLAEVSVKGGSLDEPVDLTNAIHIWTDRKLKGVTIPPGVRRFPEEPD